MPWPASPPSLTLDYWKPPFSLLLSYSYLPGSPPHSSLSGPFKMETDHITPLLKTPKGSPSKVLNWSSAPTWYGHLYPPISHPATLILAHPAPATLTSTHCQLCTKEILAQTLPFAQENSFPEYPPDCVSHHLPVTLLQPQLSLRPILDVLFTATAPAPALWAPLIHCAPHLLTHQIIYLLCWLFISSFSTKILIPQRNKSLCFLFTHVPSI